MINGIAAKQRLGLKVSLLAKDSELWKQLWHYYVRADVAMTKHGIGKIIETRSETLVAAAGCGHLI